MKGSVSLAMVSWAIRPGKQIRRETCRDPYLLSGIWTWGSRVAMLGEWERGVLGL